VRAQVVGEAFEVETQLLGVAEQRVRAEGVLVGERRSWISPRRKRGGNVIVKAWHVPAAKSAQGLLDRPNERRLLRLAKRRLGHLFAYIARLGASCKSHTTNKMPATSRAAPTT
jgi:hypothetical protein